MTQAATCGILAGTGVLATSPPKVDRPAIPVIDTHTHFYDTSRPQGVPWPSPQNELLYRPVLPAEFKQLTAPLGVKGTIIVEASPILEDNQWILDLAKDDPFFPGVMGNLDPLHKDFEANLDRFCANPIYRGIRLRGNELPKFEHALAPLENRKLTIDILRGGDEMLATCTKLAAKHPGIHFVIDHLPFDTPIPGALAKTLHRTPNIFAKVSNILRIKDEELLTQVEDYTAMLDPIWEIFGEDRVVYGSNWPVSNRVAPYGTVINIAHQYLSKRNATPTAKRKYFHDNAFTAYRLPAGGL